MSTLVLILSWLGVLLSICAIVLIAVRFIQSESRCGTQDRP